MSRWSSPPEEQILPLRFNQGLEDEFARKALLVAVPVPRCSAKKIQKMKQRRPTNPELLGAIGYLMKAGKQYQTPLWITTASFLGKSRRTRIVLNLDQVSKNLNGGKFIAVQDTVLGSGETKQNQT